MKVIKLKDKTFTFEGIEDADFQVLNEMSEKYGLDVLSDYMLLRHALDIAMQEGIKNPSEKVIQDIANEFEEVMNGEFSDMEDEDEEDEDVDETKAKDK